MCIGLAWLRQICAPRCVNKKISYFCCAATRQRGQIASNKRSELRWHGMEGMGRYNDLTGTGVFNEIYITQRFGTSDQILHWRCHWPTGTLLRYLAPSTPFVSSNNLETNKNNFLLSDLTNCESLPRVSAAVFDHILVPFDLDVSTTYHTFSIHASTLDYLSVTSSSWKHFFSSRLRSRQESSVEPINFHIIKFMTVQW